MNFKTLKIPRYFKFMIFPIIILIALLLASTIFYSQIDKLRKQIDTIYFGNFIPIHKLHTIVHNYKEIIKSDKYFDVHKQQILDDWNYYYNAYKSNDERIIVNAINTLLLQSLEKRDELLAQNMVKKINLAIDHEMSSAAISREAFLKKYDQMQTFLMYNVIAILIGSVGFALTLVISNIKHYKELEDLKEDYKLQSRTDKLTQLYNRKYFDMIFDKLCTISQKNNWESAFIMLDVDHFKQYNDTYGHDMGDSVLKAVATTLKQYFNKEYEYVFRIGGEEFGIIIFDTSKSVLMHCLDNFIDTIHKLNIEHKTSSVDLKIITVSMGVTYIDKTNYHLTPRQLYISTDKKLYNSKELGRNRYTL